MGRVTRVIAEHHRGATDDVHLAAHVVPAETLIDGTQRIDQVVASQVVTVRYARTAGRDGARSTSAF